MSEQLPYSERYRLIKLELLPKEAVAKPKKPIAKRSPAKLAELAKEKESRESEDSPLDKWFEERRKEMTGKCCLCGGVSEKKNDETYRRSIHHLLDKRKSMFPSVATHPDNWLEVCFYQNSCHTNIHNGNITWDLLHDSQEWIIIENKLKRVLPFVADTEKKNIPEQLLKWIN